jgi:ATP-dependent DNA ligase
MATWAAPRKTFCKDAARRRLPFAARSREAFAAIADAAKPARKQQITLDLLQRATPLEAKYLIKIILGDMRTGIQVSLVEEAIAAAYSAPSARFGGPGC